MTRLIYFALAAIMGFSSLNLTAQETEKPQLEILEKKKKQIELEEREALKNEVKTIVARVESGELTTAEGEKLKKQAAEKRAKNIDNKIAIVQNQIELEKRNDDNKSVSISFSLGKKDKNGKRTWGLKVDDEAVPQKTYKKYDRRTVSEFVFAFGLNNAITEGESFNDTPFKIGGSRFAEFGWAWKTRVFKNTAWLRLKYGVSFQFNGLKPKSNSIFVREDNQVTLQEFDIDLDKSKFRMDNLVVPVHFEFGPYKKVEGENYVRYRTNNKFKMGIGGYAGVNLGSRQKLKYKKDGRRVKEKQKGDFNTNSFVYGLSSYVAWGGTALYLKYDLNPIFKNNPVEQRNVSLGLRFDMD